MPGKAKDTHTGPPVPTPSLCRALPLLTAISRYPRLPNRAAVHRAVRPGNCGPDRGWSVHRFSKQAPGCRWILKKFKKGASILVIRFPKRSTVATAPHKSPPGVIAACASGRRTSPPGSAGRPRRSRASPRERWAPTGAKISGRGKCGLPAFENTPDSRPNGRADVLPPQQKRQKPLSGATTMWSAVSSATIARPLPTPGSTTATCTVPGGK